MSFSDLTPLAPHNAMLLDPLSVPRSTTRNSPPLVRYVDHTPPVSTQKSATKRPQSSPLLGIDDVPDTIKPDPALRLQYGIPYMTFVDHYNIFHRLLRAIPTAFTSLFETLIAHGCDCHLSKAKGSTLMDSLEALAQVRERLLAFCAHARDESKELAQNIRRKMTILHDLDHECNILSQVVKVEAIVQENTGFRVDRVDDAIMFLHQDIDPLLTNAHKISNARHEFQQEAHRATLAKLQTLNEKIVATQREFRELDEETVTSVKALRDIKRLFEGWEGKWGLWLAEHDEMIRECEEQWDGKVRQEASLGEKRACELCEKRLFVGRMDLMWVKDAEEILAFGPGLDDVPGSLKAPECLVM